MASSQTLVLIDNSLSVSKVNREITKETLKYFFTHSKEGKAYCFAPFSHSLDYAESYTEDYIGLEDMASRLTYENKGISLTDVITGKLNEWQEGDFACRDILIFTDGKEEESINYEREELFFMLEHSDYPVYIVCLCQEGNEGYVKNLSAIARVSGGELFHSDFEGSDAEVERLLTQKIQNSMEKYASANWSFYDEKESSTDKLSDGESGKDNTAENAEENAQNGESANLITEVIEEENEENLSCYNGNMDEDVLIQTEVKTGLGPEMYAITGGVLFFFLCMIFICWCIYLRHKKRIKDEDEGYRNRVLLHVREREREFSDNFEYDAKGMEMYPERNPEKYLDRDLGRHSAQSGVKCHRESKIKSLGQTVSLHRRLENNDFDNATRLLYEGAGQCDLTFEDANDPSKYYKVASNGKIILGRNKDRCDLALEYDDSVSSRHCEISLREDGYYVRDLESSNGTFINGEKVYTEGLLRNGDMLRLGSLSLIVGVE